MSSGYDLMEMVHRYFYLMSGNPLQAAAFKLGGAFLAFALIAIIARGGDR